MHLDALKKANNNVRCIYVCKICGHSTTDHSNFRRHLVNTEKIEGDTKIYREKIN